MNTKAALRKTYLDKRLQLSQADGDTMSQNLLKQFKVLDLKGISYLHLFWPIEKRNEPDTVLISNWVKENHPQINLVYPKTNFVDHTMQSYIADVDLKMGINAFGIPEPISGNQVAASRIDMILIPLLAFDKQGYRVGYGKGFYDRFMAGCRTDCRFIGLSFFDPVDQINDVDRYDVKMQACITPGKVWEF